MKNMKFNTLILALIMTVATTMSFAQDKTKYYNLDDTKIGLNGYSPISYFEEGRPEKGSKHFKSSYEGINYYFTNQSQKATFDKSPNKYVPAYGGWCAFGVSVGGLFRADPENYKIVDGELLVFLNDIELDARNLWVNTPNGDVENTKNAKANWSKFSKGQRPKK